MADCGSFDDAVMAAEAGSAILSTTLAGYTGERPKTDAQIWSSLRKLSRHSPISR